MSGGQLAVPLVVRIPSGPGRQLAAQHSHTLEGWYAHVPGLRVLAPATVADARGMLAPALADPDPVLIFEQIGLYGLGGELPADPGPVDITTPRSAMRAPTSPWSATAGRSPPRSPPPNSSPPTAGPAEVVDLRVLRPLDDATLLDSVRRTHRLVIVDNAWRSGSLAAEVAARVAEQAFYDLDAPIERVCGAEVPMPYPHHLEETALPSVADVVAAADRTGG
jgi:pyruvate dehydrogenase E1 component beta subunit